WHALGDRKNSLHTEIRGIDLVPVNVSADLSQSGGVADQTFHFFLSDNGDHLSQLLVIQVGTVHHDQVLRDAGQKAFLRVISHPHTDKGVLHADIVTSRG